MAKIQGHKKRAKAGDETKETNGTRMDADEMQKSMTSEKATQVMEKQSHQRMSNDTFIPGLHPHT